MTSTPTTAIASPASRPSWSTWRPPAYAATTRKMPERATGVSGESRRSSPPRGVPARPAVPRGLAHSPADSASPTSVSRSRSRAASSGSRPGIIASVSAEAVCSSTRGQPEAALQRPDRDVDQLHPAVGHDREGPEHRTVGDPQLRLQLGVAPVADPPPDHPHLDAEQHHQHHHARAGPRARTSRSSSGHHDHGQGDAHAVPRTAPRRSHPGQAGLHPHPGLARRREEVVHPAQHRQRAP